MTAATGRDDYDHAVKLATLDPGEPLFVLRGRDAVAGDTVRAWAGLAHRAGAPDEAVELALQQADRIDAWPLKKAPDGPDLEDHQRKQLRNQLGRRAWTARARLQGDTEVLAHRMGQDAVLGRLRPLLTALDHAFVEGNDVAPILAEIFAVAGRSAQLIKGRRMTLVEVFEAAQG